MDLTHTFSGKRYNRVNEEAARLGVSVRNLRDLMKEHTIPFIQYSRTIWFDPQKVDAALAKFERKAA
jgi:hypothetical protein